MFPATNGRDKGLSYLLLGEALATGKLRVTERGKGTAPDLTLENETDQMAFLMDGEALVGAKQNRILNTSILAAANSSMTMPMSCAEQGRWQYAGAAMRKRPISYPNLRNVKHRDVHDSLKRYLGCRSDQGSTSGRA